MPTVCFHKTLKKRVWHSILHFCKPALSHWTWKTASVEHLAVLKTNHFTLECQSNGAVSIKLFFFSFQFIREQQLLNTRYRRTEWSVRRCKNLELSWWCCNKELSASLNSIRKRTIKQMSEYFVVAEGFSTSPGVWGGEHSVIKVKSEKEIFGISA